MLELASGCRLHFGLLELFAGQPNRFGGLGVMLNAPGWRLQFGFSTSRKIEILDSELSSDAAMDVVHRIEQVRQRVETILGRPLDCEIRVHQGLPMHHGLGAGTQLAATVAAGLLNLAGELTVPSNTNGGLAKLLQASGRGRRSGIGLFGYLNGGLILDEGLPADFNENHPSERPMRLQSFDVPQAWTIVLLIPPHASLVTGQLESALICQVGNRPNLNRDRMLTLAKAAIASLGTVDFDCFADALQEYVDLSGQLFSATQNGIYNGPIVAEAVEIARRAGLRAVGQSSWGPTVFGFSPTYEQAQFVADRLLSGSRSAGWKVIVSTVRGKL